MEKDRKMERRPLPGRLNLAGRPWASNSDRSMSSGGSVASNSSIATSVYRQVSSYSNYNSLSQHLGQSKNGPRPVLLTDASHRPRTHGSVGILVVGIGGANGTTLLSGILANRHGLRWRGPRGEPMSANYFGCITQLDERGDHGGVGYRNKVKGLADASMAAVGGWDIRPSKLGDALLDQQILDYDMVKQLKDEMNKTKVFRGYYDERFIGTSQHATATHVLTEKEAPNAGEALKSIRADIRYFKWRNGVVGHTTVIWSASVEPNSEFCVEGGGLETAQQLLESIEMSEEERGGPLPPSLIYATAAILEGCSFVNGGSQNTLCGGLADLARRQLGVYCLGTDFKAGQTKFKTAAVEYIRTMGLTPKVIASSNHLGNNDMHNLATADQAAKAKLRVKHDIFKAWQEDIDHKVSIMYTPMINDEKRDFVEYTSLGFLGQTHTMVTYTRASDSVLCVPLLIDSAVWCDFFSHRSWPYENVAKALAYLFKVPEGAAKGVDPGFFRQMQELDSQAVAACNAKDARKKEGQKRRVRIRPEEKTAEWAIPNDAAVVCAGLACVDMQLNQATGGDGGESIETFQGEKSIGGGSVSMACKTMARLCHGAPLDENYIEITPPVVHSVIPLCKVGDDSTGDKLISLLEGCGGASRNISTRHIKAARKRDPAARTALAVLPIYQDGRRGCFFDAASNATFTSTELVEMIQELTAGAPAPSLDTSNLSSDDLESYRERVDQSIQPHAAFLFGYPHLLPMMQGEYLAHIFSKARASMEDGGIIAMDLNGVPDGMYHSVGSEMRSVHNLQNDPIIGPALNHVDILHMNEDELCNLTGCDIQGTLDSEMEDDFAVAKGAQLFLMCGVAVVAVTRGKKGCFICCNDEERFARSKMLPSSWIDCTTKLDAMELPPDTVINTNGAGDSFTAGFLIAALLRHTGMTVQVRNVSEIVSYAGSATGSVMEGVSEHDDDVTDLSVDLDPTPVQSSPSKKKLTPYMLYMRENYVSLKAQCNDDKKAIFSKCHEMWENETDDVKVLYERKANEEMEEQHEKEQKEQELQQELKIFDDQHNKVDDDLSSTDESHRKRYMNDPMEEINEDENRNLYLANKALNLESAAQFASLVAAHHIDVSTRDLDHLDISTLLERSMIFPHGLEEI